MKMASLLPHIKVGRDSADEYHLFVMGAFTALFYPSLIAPKKEWEINDGRKRIDILYTNASDAGFFSDRRDERGVNANVVVVECKNYSKDIANPELDQLIGRFSDSGGKFGIISCRGIDNEPLLLARCKDAVRRNQGRIIYISDTDLIRMLNWKSQMNDQEIERILFRKYSEIIT